MPGRSLSRSVSAFRLHVVSRFALRRFLQTQISRLHQVLCTFRCQRNTTGYGSLQELEHCERCRSTFTDLEENDPGWSKLFSSHHHFKLYQRILLRS